MSTSFSDANGRKIVSTSTADTVGKIDGFVVDPDKHAVVALEVKKSDDGDMLLWRDIASFGEDAVTVSGKDKIVDAPSEIEGLLGKDHGLKGKRILTTLGVELGKVKDVEFDAETGTVTSIVFKGGQVPGSSLTGVGSYAVVVSD